MKFYPPKYLAQNFHCPYCQVYSSQTWTNPFLRNGKLVPKLSISECAHCNEYSHWYEEKLIVPNTSIAPIAHQDMPEDIRIDYEEARLIVNVSPRGAAALLRLCIQKLMIELGEKGKNINTDIKELVEKGLPEEVQQSLDILRVVGNESVHPGELDIRDDPETSISLFELINFIIEDRITRKKRIRLLYSKLPESKRKEIDSRDKDS